MNNACAATGSPSTAIPAAHNRATSLSPLIDKRYQPLARAHEGAI
jgi:hypothetical protein